MLAVHSQEVEILAPIKYRDAISLYAHTSLPLKTICEQTGVAVSSFSSYLSRHHRELILDRNNLTFFENVKLRGSKGQTTASYYKYKSAISACLNNDYLTYSISQIARLFSVNCSGLCNQLRRHYPLIILRREEQRRHMGINKNLQYGARPNSKSVYLSALKLLQSSSLSLEEVAERCHVSHSGLRDHILSYHPELSLQRSHQRHSEDRHPGSATTEKYRVAVELYKNSTMDLASIVHSSGVTLGGLRYHLRRWHPELIALRHARNNKKKETKSTPADKYSNAIKFYSTSGDSLRSISLRLGINYQVLHRYIKQHHPEAIEQHNKHLSGSAERFKEGLAKLQTGTATIGSIIHEYGYSEYFRTYIKKHYPELLEQKRKQSAKGLNINGN